MQPKPLHVLVSPLDWGLGHASRSIPVIRQLLAAGHKVTIAGYGRSLFLLQKEFPSLESIELKGFSPSYPRNGKVILHLLFLLPRFISSILKEHFHLKKLINQHQFDIVISDNRYGLWNKNVKSILITHQVMLKTPHWLKIAEYPLYLVSRLLISRFDECWIPDYKDAPGLSGDLSHKYPLPGNAKFIGPLSRFQRSDQIVKSPKQEKSITAVISGPEPQRSIFEEMLTLQLAALNLTATILSGRPETEITSASKGNLKVFSHATGEDFQAIIESSSLIICRSGYSSIMDFDTLGTKALFVPTPGQTEQIYLAKLLHIQGIALWRKQDDLDLKTDINEALKYTGFEGNIKKQELHKAIEGLKKK
jgi:uncharacterized protein (TIGR00661 family)